MSLPILVLDFDGVIHRYDAGPKYDPAIVHSPPTEGALDAIADYLNHFDVQIFSSRTHQVGGLAAMQDWMLQYLGKDITSRVGWPLNKPPALITLDDRAITFTGAWPTVAALKAFRPWNRK